LRPSTEAALLGFHRTVAEIAVKVAAITGLDNLKTFGNAIHVCVPSVRLRKPGSAGFSAIGTPQIFNPTVEDDSGVQRHVNSLRAERMKDTQKGPLKIVMLRRRTDALRWRLNQLSIPALPGEFVEARWVKYPRYPQFQKSVVRLRCGPPKGASKRSLCR
jgi:hypothetical protein